jgi:hypothetical protein
MIMSGSKPYGILCFQILHELIKANILISGKHSNNKSIEKILLVNFISSGLGLYLLNILPLSVSKGIEYITFWYISIIIRNRFKSKNEKFNFYVSALTGLYSITNDLILILMGVVTVYPNIHLYESEVKTFFGKENAIKTLGNIFTHLLENKASNYRTITI